MTSRGILLLILLCALLLRAYGLGEQYYSYDEMMHIQMANAPSLEKAYEFTLFELHPPLPNIIRYFWQKYSDDPAYSRILSLIPGMLMVLSMYFLGRKVGNETTGLAAAFIAAFAHGAVIMSQVVRNYSLLGFVLTLTIYFFLEYKDKRKLFHLVLFSLLATIAVSVHLIAAFVIAGLVGAFAIASTNMQKGKQSASQEPLITFVPFNDILKIAIACIPAAILFGLTYMRMETAWAIKYYVNKQDYFGNILMVLPNSLLNARFFLLPEGLYMGYDGTFWFYVNMGIGCLVLFAIIIASKKESFLLRAAGFTMLLCAFSGSAGDIVVAYSARRMFFIFPFIALIGACALTKFKYTREAIILASIPLTLIGLLHKPFLPDEHTIKTENMNKIFEFTEKNFGKDDILIVDKWHAQYFYQWAGKSEYIETSPYKLDENKKFIIAPIKNLHVAYDPYFTIPRGKKQFGDVGINIEILQTLEKQNLTTPNTRIWFGAFSARYDDHKAFATCINAEPVLDITAQGTIYKLPNSELSDLIGQAQSCNLNPL